MKLVIAMPDSIDAENVGVVNPDAAVDGQVLGSHHEVHMEPIFYSKTALVNGPSVRLLDDGGKVICAGVLRISGKTGQISFEKRMNPVKPAISELA